MLNMGMSNFNFNATSSIVNESEQKIVIADFGASYSGDQIYLNYNIMNKDLYKDYESDVDADFEEFKTNVLKAVGEIK
jgi:hypothetical protein